MRDLGLIVAFTCVGLSGGVMFFALLVRAVKDGQMRVYGRKVRREDEPIAYWIGVITIVGFGCFCACLGLFAAFLGK